MYRFETCGWTCFRHDNGQSGGGQELALGLLNICSRARQQSNDPEELNMELTANSPELATQSTAPQTTPAAAPATGQHAPDDAPDDRRGDVTAAAVTLPAATAAPRIVPAAVVPLGQRERLVCQPGGLLRLPDAGAGFRRPGRGGEVKVALRFREASARLLADAAAALAKAWPKPSNWPSVSPPTRRCRTSPSCMRCRASPTCRLPTACPSA